jgi:hypothetical protein
MFNLRNLNNLATSLHAEFNSDLLTPYLLYRVININFDVELQYEIRLDLYEELSNEIIGELDMVINESIFN